ncbi:hypothetical protein Mjas_06450 [Methanothermococcus sp. Ax23]|uniref:hypothetical protein n=1 Tax=Methanothermococcus sp. Ax23 TaxID=3156486 RepID=UPI003B9E0FD6
MIFDSDILIAVIIIIVGMGFFTSSMVEHTNNYADAVKTNILYDKVVYQLKSLISDGTLETAVLLLNTNNSDIAKSVLKNKIGLKNYELKIGNYPIIPPQGDLNSTKTIMVSATILMNRTEGWYGIYGNDDELHITNKYFISENETYNYLNTYYNSYPYKKAIYYFNSSNPINITLIYGD